MITKPCLRAGIVILLAATLCFGLALSGRAEADPPKIRVLILTGQNNHDWQATTPILEKTLSESGRFVVEVTARPGSLTPGDLERFDVLLSNWTTFPDAEARPWTAEFQKAFLDFIKVGKGFVVVHAGGTMFYDWPEYHRLIGATWGRDTGHGRPHEFAVTFVDADHPICRGLSSFQITDELWHRMQVNGKRRVVATAFSAEETGGSGQDEPVATVTEWENGRCFNLVLGHDVQAMTNPGFAKLLARGTEWAATGKVRAAVGDPAGSVDAAIQEIAGYQLGQSRNGLREVERRVSQAATDAAGRASAAAALAARLEGNASIDCKKFLCRQLSLIGGPAEVPVLARHLSDSELAFFAREALERIPGEESLAALRVALGQSSGLDRIGLINSLSARGDARAVGLLGALTTTPDQATAAAAIDALGHLGGSEARQALEAAKGRLAPELEESIAYALLRCADRMRAAGQVRSARELYRKLYGPEESRPIRLAAFPAYLACAGEEGDAHLLAALGGPDPDLQAGALRALRTSPRNDLMEKVAARLATLPKGLQVSVILLFAERGAGETLPAVVEAASAQDQAVRQAALTALGSLGDASTVGVLAAAAEHADAEDRKIIRASLASLSGDGVEAALTAALSQAGPATQVELINALVHRQVDTALPAILPALASSNGEVRLEAIQALGALGDARVCLSLIGVLENSSDGDRAAVERALAGICKRTGDVGPVVQMLAKTVGAGKASLIAVLGAVGHANALAPLQEALQSEEEAVRHAAIQALSEWPDGAPLDDLLRVVETFPDARSKRLALRGMARLAAQAKDWPAAERVDLLVKALALADRAEEKKALLSALGTIPRWAAMEAAQAQLQDPATAEEAGLAVLQIAEQMESEHDDAVRGAIQKVRETTRSAAVASRALAVAFQRDAIHNLASGATASSPDGHEADGQASGDQAAIDGDPSTYWDEADNQRLYRLIVALPAPATVSRIRILGYQHQRYAPKDFEIRCDDRAVQTVRDAAYQDNRLEVVIPPTRCQTVELRITGYYGASPAIRELQVLGDAAGAARALQE